MLYDAGRGGGVCAAAVREMIPSGRIDLIVLSHSDEDHIAEIGTSSVANQVAAIIHPGDDHPFTRRGAEGKRILNDAG